MADEITIDSQEIHAQTSDELIIDTKQHMRVTVQLHTRTETCVPPYIIACFRECILVYVLVHSIHHSVMYALVIVLECILIHLLVNVLLYVLSKKISSCMSTVCFS